jgi:hypothetical protein
MPEYAAPLVRIRYAAVDDLSYQIQIQFKVGFGFDASLVML